MLESYAEFFLLRNFPIIIKRMLWDQRSVIS